MTELKSELIFEYEAELDVPQMFKPSHVGTRLFLPLKSGTVKGPKLNGIMLPGGGDWLVIRNDGANEIDARFTIQTDDNEIIYTYYRGITMVSPEVQMRIESGEKVDPGQYYYRTTPVFETGAEKYAWLNRIICIGVGTIGGWDRASYKVFQIL